MDAPTRRIATLAMTLTLTGLVGCSEPAQPDPPTTDSEAPTEETPAAPASFASVVTAVEDRVAVYDGIATGVIALVRVGDETEVVTGGLADVKADEPMEPGLTFPIASITKPMTATLVMQLVAEGLLELDDPAQEWLPELRTISDPITIENLLSHRSGVPDSSDDDFERIGLGATARLLAAAAGRGLDSPPGKEGTYSNLGFAALGLLVERVLDQPLAEVMEERIFAPAGMASSSLFGRPEIQGYADTRPIKNYYLEAHPGAGSVVATVGDVDAFFRTLWDGDLVRPRTVSDMRESRGQVSIGPFWRPDYGLGLIHYKVSCGMALGHSGRIGGFTNEAWTLEGSDRSTVVTVNDESADDIARSIVEVALCE